MPNSLLSFVACLLRLPRPLKRTVIMSVDLATIPLALWSALSLRLGSVEHGEHSAGWLYLIAVLASVLLFARCGLYRAVLRFIAGTAMLAVLAGVSASVALTILVDRLLLNGVVPLSAYAIYFVIAMLYVSGSRLLAHALLGLLSGSRNRVIIYGAGEAGVNLARALQKHKEFRPVAFVDDDRSQQGNVMLGLKVFAPALLESLIVKLGARSVLLALPSASRSRRREIIQRLEGLDVHVQTVPDLSEIISGRTRVEKVRDIDVADLLSRDAIAPSPCLLARCIEQKSVMVTGAGGSIGSELCRQIVRLAPRRLVLLEMSEHALYQIDRELRNTADARACSVEIIALLGNAGNKNRLRDVMRTFDINTVYHAAAYKHVPIVEGNIGEGISNNIIATLHTAQVAEETGVETFVLISSDKAVNPTNVMGATKRVSELILQGLQGCGGRTRFCMVRFGNVLDSSGSVVPLFREQIRRGGPVTVTHPEAKRYFMTIPEAAQLVIQAGSMAGGGEVFVLEMGQPVCIAELARRMIRLMGCTVRDDQNPNGDIAIEYTGLRPGEKLFEELLLGDNIMRTDHPRILRAFEQARPWSELCRFLDELQASARKFDCEWMIQLLSEVVEGYKPAPALADILTTRRATLEAHVGPSSPRRSNGRKRSTFTATVLSTEQASSQIPAAARVAAAHVHVQRL
jgi:FlaA1/EpsC-like NDP-sugar epimerase